jgi:hypothetical protein
MLGVTAPALVGCQPTCGSHLSIPFHLYPFSSSIPLFRDLGSKNKGKENRLRAFQVLMAANMKMKIALMMEAARTSEKSVYFDELHGAISQKAVSSILGSCSFPLLNANAPQRLHIYK